jgi:hypothetical protein
MIPIAVYQARLPNAKLQFELYEDSIRAVGSRAGVDFDTTLALTRLENRPERLWVHSILFYVGFLLVMIAAVVLMAFVTFAEMQDRPPSLVKPYGFVGGFGAVGLILALVNSRKIEHARFRNDAGMPVLDIPRNRGKSEDFGQFVDLLIERISKVRREPRPTEVMPDER